jgi:hypothetical protein
MEAVRAIHRVADSLEQQVRVVDGLADSVGPLTESVNRLNATMIDLVTLLSPMAAAERDVQDVERFLRFRRRKQAPPTATPTDTQGG